MTTFDKDGNILSYSEYPTDSDGRVLSYEEVCAMQGAPFTDDQRAVRKALYDYEKLNGGFMEIMNDAGKLAEWHRLGKAIRDVDSARFDALREAGWEWGMKDDE